MKSKELKITYIVLFVVLLFITNIAFADGNESSKTKDGNDAFLEWLENEESDNEKSKTVSDRITVDSYESNKLKSSEFDLFQDDNENGINDKFEKDRSDSYKTKENSTSTRKKSSSSSSKSSYTPSSKTKNEDKNSSSSRSRTVKSSSSSKSRKRISK